MKCLLIDDDPVFLAVGEAMLQSLGHEVAAVASNGELGAQAIAHAGAAIDVVILDLNMPGFDGLAFLREIASAAFTGQVIISSGETDAVIRSAQRMGEILGVRVIGALKKPIQMPALINVLEQCGKDVRPSPRQRKSHDGYGLSGSTLVPYYQPQFNAHTRTIVGLEALIRIATPDGTLHGPDYLLSNITTHDQLVTVSLDIVRKILEDMAAWRAAGSNGRVSINFDARVIEDPRAIPELIELVHQSGIPEHQICLELTEVTLPANLGRIIELLTRLRMSGYQLSLDDYGTGGSNYELLRLCPFNELKIDRSIVNSAASEKHAKLFMDNSIAMARDLDMVVVAEGVETELELEMVKKCGIELVQGFLLSRPLPAAQAQQRILGPEDGKACPVVDGDVQALRA